VPRQRRVLEVTGEQLRVLGSQFGRLRNRTGWRSRESFLTLLLRMLVLKASARAVPDPDGK
jgi:hypothetical protein